MFPLLFRFASALVDEKGASCCAATVIGLGCAGLRARVSWHIRLTAGRTGLSDMGIRRALARDVRDGCKDRIVVVYGVL